MQVTAEQIVREARERQEDDYKAPTARLTDPEEIAEYRMEKRKFFEDSIRYSRSLCYSFLFSLSLSLLGFRARHFLELYRFSCRLAGGNDGSLTNGSSTPSGRNNSRITKERGRYGNEPLIRTHSALAPPCLFLSDDYATIDGQF